ncbi:glycoside hydrolase family 88/105 protein [Sphingobacterium sp. LRF_L2]|uniref:glycoside hydrolase family 88/105 protein n=1 Tax=Sphingobacterium sp. LRF_L2 TaxID=3369421 RepID=UPI003F6357B9
MMKLVKKIKCSTSVIFLLFLTSRLVGQDNAINMVNSEIKRNPEAWMIDFSKAPKWNYCHGLVMQAILQLEEKTKQRKYYDYVFKYADMMVLKDGSIKTYNLEEYNIDRVNTGKILFPILRKTGDERFKKALLLLRSQMKSHPRTLDGSFWHKKIYPHQVWLDGLYMAMPFLAQFALEFEEPKIFDDVVLQLADVHKHLYDKKTGLYYHGWDERKIQGWADPKTGLSSNFWSRSIGWYMMALVDALDFIPVEHPKRNELIYILQELSNAVANFQDRESGMWYQVTDQGHREGNYLEATGSIMFIYSWVKAAQKGYIDHAFLDRGTKAYEDYVVRFVKEEPDDYLIITDCCAVAGLSADRDGSFEYYISEPVRENDPKAVGPFIMTSLLLNR